MNGNVQNTMAAGMTFALVAGVLVVLAAMIGDLLCRVQEWGSRLAGRFVCAEGPSYGGPADHAGRDGTTAVCGN